MGWKFFGKTEFTHSFWRFAQNYAETVPFHKISKPENEVKLRYFSQCKFSSDSTRRSKDIQS